MFLYLRDGATFLAELVVPTMPTLHLTGLPVPVRSASLGVGTQGLHGVGLERQGPGVNPSILCCVLKCHKSYSYHF